MLSIDQLLEWIRVELVPQADPDMAALAWSDLKYEGNLDVFFAKMQTLSMYNPLPARQAQILASHQFGPALTAHLQAAMAQTGTQGLSRVQYEAVVRSYVITQEATPGFMGWGKQTVGPLVKKTHPQHQTHVLGHAVATSAEDLEYLQEAEVWGAACVVYEEGGKRKCIEHGMAYPGYCKAKSLYPPVVHDPNTMIDPKYNGRCLICLSTEHQWIRCAEKKKGGCAKCSGPHRTIDCATLRIPRPNKDSQASRGVAARAVATDLTPPLLQADAIPVTSPPELTPSVDTPNLAKDQVDESRPVNASGEVVTMPLLGHSDVKAWRARVIDDGDVPTWVQECMWGDRKQAFTRKGQLPLSPPGTSDHLLYRVTIEGREAEALLDHGASRSFISREWLVRQRLPATKREKPLTLLHFQGAAPAAVTHQYEARSVELCRQTISWNFLVAAHIPADVVIGLDYIRKMRVLFDPCTDRIFVLGSERDTHPRRSREVSAAVRQVAIDEADAAEPLATFCNLPKGEWATLPAQEDWGARATDPESLTLYSVTANSIEDSQILQEFRDGLDKDLLEVIDRTPQLFAPPDREPPEREVKHHIRVHPDAVPIKRRPYPLPPHKLKEMHLQIRELVDNGWIEPSESPWGAPILFVPKKNDTLRMCVDFRDLNAVTIDDSYPLPRIEVMLHKAASATVFSKLDLASGFHQIEVGQASRPLTAFRLPEASRGHSLWQWKVMPFGLRNAPPTFQRAMESTLADSGHCAVVYIDDILVFSCSRGDHLSHLATVFGKLASHSYHTRLPKCEFMKEEVEFLGHKLSKGGISTHPDKVKALTAWPMPLTTPSQVKSFLGLVMWYRSFIPHLSTIAAPLFALTSARKRFEWTLECAEAAARLQQAVTQAPVLVR